MVEVLLFDLGGVLIDWDGTTPLVAHSAGRLSREQARRFWLASDWVKKQDLGLCTVDEFADGAIAELGLDFTRADFISAYTGWIKGAYPGTHAVLEQLKKNHRLATLTNNNHVHFSRVDRDLDLKHYFSDIFASHLLGMKKPDPEIYQHVTQALGVPAEHIAFFDDNPECLHPARELGWQVFHTRGLEQVKAALRELGIDPAY